MTQPRFPDHPPVSHAAAPWSEANARGLAFAAIADWRLAAAAFAEAASALAHDSLHGAPADAQALVLSNLAHACARDGRLEAAISHAHRALEVREALAGASSPLAARTRMDLAVLLASRGAVGEARPLLDAALSQLETTYGSRDVRLLGVLENAARLSLMTGDLARASAEVQRLRGVAELHEVPMDRVTALTDRLAAAGVPVSAPEPEPLVTPWSPPEPVSAELPAPWSPEESHAPMWDAADTEDPVPARDIPLWDAPLDEAPASLADLPAWETQTELEAAGEEGAPGLRQLPAEDEDTWPLLEPAGLAPVVASYEESASTPEQLTELEPWDHRVADAPSGEAPDSVWSSLLEESQGSGALEPVTPDDGWDAPSSSPASADPVQPPDDALLPWLTSSPAEDPATPFPHVDVPWLEAFPGDSVTPGRLLDEPEPEIPEFLRPHALGAEDSGVAVATPESVPLVDEDGEPFVLEPEVPTSPPPHLSGGSGALPLVSTATQWGRTGAATPHEGTVAVNPSPINKYDEILQRVRKQTLADRADRSGAKPAGARILVLSAVTVAAVGVGGGLWWTLLR